MKADWRTFGPIGPLLLLLITGTALSQQENHADVVKATFCDLYSQPQKYAGKIVEVHAMLYGYRDPILEPPGSGNKSCPSYMRIGFEFPQDAKTRPNFDVLKDESFQTLDRAWQQGMRVEATFVGRFDPIFVWRDRMRIRVGECEGFGRKHLDDGRIVVWKVSDVAAHVVPSK